MSRLWRITLAGKKDRNARDQQRLGQAFDDRIEQCSQVGLRVEAPVSTVQPSFFPPDVSDAASGGQ